MTGIRRALGIAFLSQYAELLIQFIGVLILARIISSEEIGIYSVAAFLMAILHVFRDFGVAKYVIQEEHLSPEKLRSAFGVAIILAWSVALVLAGASGVVADFYDEPQIESILFIMAGSFAVTPVGSLLNSLFRREMDMKKVAIVRISSVVCHVIVAVGLGMLGMGALSLAWANFANILSFGIVAALLRPPGTPLTPRFTGMREILSFGSVASLGSVASVAGTNSPDVIIGKAISLEATGYYSRANGLVQMFKTVISGAVAPLVLPYFAQTQRKKESVVEPYHLAMQQLTVFAWPFFAVMALLALPLVRTLYGMNWDVSVPVVRVLCLAGAISMLATFAGDVMIAHGQVKGVTKVQLVIQPIRVLAILGGSLFGLMGVGLAIVASEVLTVLVFSHLLYKTTAIRLRGVLRATSKSALVTLCAMIGPAAVVTLWPQGPYEWPKLMLGGLTAFFGWSMAIWWFTHPMRSHLADACTWLMSNVRFGSK